LQPLHSFLALACGFPGSSQETYICSYRSVRQSPYLYEHMFPRSTPPPLTRRARNALSLARSFLLLEDDYDVDWEVDQVEPGRGDACGRADTPGESHEPGPRHVVGRHDTATADLHPHRRPLRRRSARVRAGQPAPAFQVCLCPLDRGHGMDKPTEIRTGRPQAARM